MTLPPTPPQHTPDVLQQTKRPLLFQQPDPPHFLAFHRKSNRQSVSGSLFRRPRQKSQAPQPQEKVKRSLSTQLKEAEQLAQALQHASAEGGREARIAIDMKQELRKYANGLQTAAAKAVDEERMEDFSRISQVVDIINRRLDDEAPESVASPEPPQQREIASEWMSHSSSAGRKAQWSEVWGGDAGSEVGGEAAPFRFYEGPPPNEPLRATDEMKPASMQPSESLVLTKEQAPIPCRPQNGVTLSAQHVPIAEYEAAQLKVAKLTEIVEEQKALLEDQSNAIESKDKMMKDVSARLQRAEKDASDYKELWMRENARASSLSAALDEKESLLLDHSANAETLKTKLHAATKRIKQLEFLMSQDQQKSCLGITASDELSDVHHLTITKREIVSRRDEASAEWRDTAPTSSESIQRDLKDDSRDVLLNDIEPVQDERFRSLMMRDGGVLHVEPGVIEVGFRKAVEGERAIVRLYYGNLTMGCLDDFSVDFLHDTDTTVTWSIEPIPDCISHGQQLCQSFVALVSSPFLSRPTCQIRFLLPDATPCVIKINIPLSSAHFLTPTTLSNSSFLQHWRSPTFLLSEVSCVVVVRPDLLNPMTRLSERLQMNHKFDLHIGIDADPRTLMLAGTFPASPAQLVLARCELGAKALSGRAKISVRSECARLAQAVRSTMAQLISV